MLRCKSVGVVAVACVAAVCCLWAPTYGVASASAISWWNITAMPAPSTLPSSGHGDLYVTVTNLGDASADGEAQPITVSDVLPKGLTATAITAKAGADNRIELPCDLSLVSCTFGSVVAPYGELRVEIEFVVSSGVGGTFENTVNVRGGDTRAASATESLVVGGAAANFGVHTLDADASNEDGSPDAQAGSHPFQLTTTVTFNQALFGGVQGPASLVKDQRFDLPAGIVGNPAVIPQCTEAQFYTKLHGSLRNECPADTAVGVAAVVVSDTSEAHRLGTLPFSFVQPLFNLTPTVGEPARFGFVAVGIPVILDTSVRSGGDYGVVVSARDITQALAFDGAQVTFWGVPADARHDLSRGWGCLENGQFGVGGCTVPSKRNMVPFLTLSTSCMGPLKIRVSADAWVQSEGPPMLDESVFHEDPQGMEGCQRLDFKPSVSVAPDGQAGSTPTGLTVGVHVPQGATLNPAGLAEADVRDTTGVLPDGVAINPAGADGLQACSMSQVGFEKVDPVSGMSLFSPGGVSCPDASKIGTVEIKTPLLPNSLVGAAYLAQQYANPFGSLIAMYLVAEDPVSGVLVKVAGKVVADPVTGQLVSTFANTPQLPYEDLKLHFFGGDRAPLVTPRACGTYKTVASFTSWAEPRTAVARASDFAITSGPQAAPCASPAPFDPSLSAGSTSVQAGGFTPFTATVSREDGQQTLDAIQLRLPPGLLGMLSRVKLCQEPQAAQGTCGLESLIGHTIVSVGEGGDPFSVSAGRVYITGPYRGAPYGLTIVNPAKAGPFDVGQGACDCVIVRAAVNVDPTTAALTVTSDPLPRILDGIPLEIRHVNVTVDRPGFTFNPTTCNPLQITGQLSSSEGLSANVSSHFQVTNCASLAFKPSFKVSTSGHTSRARGASLDVKLSFPAGSQGSEANVAQVKVSLPRQLPSQLKTLKEACPARVFDANPGACPAGSIVGVAKASTPVLPVQLTGPVYFVSHGGEEFPSLVIVLEGDGVRVDLTGSTFISKAGITSSTFRTVPDVPVSRFELYLPQGSHPALAANTNLCRVKGGLHMPTVFTAQDGAVIKQSTPITVTGCGAIRASRARGARVKAKATRKGGR